jgi:malate dehydrogenase
VAIISNPVNSTVPIAAEVLRRHGVYDPRKLLGVTTLDVVRARAFVAEAAGASPEGFRVPVVGGHAGVTILPLISQAATACGRRVSPGLSEEKIAALTARIQDAGTEVVTAKAGKGSATLSMAYAAFEFSKSCLRAMGGERGVVECAYVECLDSPVSGAPFFARPVVLGTQGIEEYLPLGPLSASEKQGLGKLAGELQSSIKKGVEFARTLK